MKQTSLLFMAILIILPLIVTTGSCKKDDSANCDRECYFGTWKATEDCGNGTFVYTVTITASASGDDKIEIGDAMSGLGGCTITATVNNNKFTFPNEICGNDTLTTGTATLSSDGQTLDITYTAHGDSPQGPVTNFCSGSWVKQ